MTCKIIAPAVPINAAARVLIHDRGRQEFGEQHRGQPCLIATGGLRLQLADIAWPGVLQQDVERIGRDPASTSLSSSAANRRKKWSNSSGKSAVRSRNEGS